MTTTSSKTTTVNATPKATPLFGGALSIVLPGDTDNTYLDVSTFRQVPDNQEVFVDGSRTDDSVIVELLECADEEQQTPAGFHLAVLAEENHANAVHLVDGKRVDVRVADPTTDSIAVSLQHAAKFNRDDDSASWIVVAVFVRRLVDHGTDVVVSWNRPVTSSDEGKTSAMVIDNAEDATRVWLEDTPAVAQFQRMIDSLTVVDASIFG